MRRNLDQSEAAIIQVFEEKQRVWERQMDELRQNYASRLQQVTSLHMLIQLNILKMSLHFFIFLYSHLESTCNLCEILEEVQNPACGQNLMQCNTKKFDFIRTIQFKSLRNWKLTVDVLAGSVRLCSTCR